MSRRMGRGKTTPQLIFVTATPATISADAVAELSCLAEGASIEEESESSDDVNSGCDAVAGEELRCS